MNCPSCQRTLPAGQQACPACGAALALPVDGALATDPQRRAEPLRELPGRRKPPRERTWKDEVKERVDRRRQQGGASTPGGDLPLFREPEPVSEPADVPAPVRPTAVEDGPRQLGTDAFRVPPAHLLELDADGPQEPRRRAERLRADADDVDVALLGSLPAADLPLNALDDVEEVPLRPSAPAARLFDEPVEDEWPLDEASNPALPRPVERPAQLAERAQAALLDLGVMAALSAVVIYFAGRAAKVPLSGLQPAWPYLLGYLALLGLLYAAYFTGTTGQTLGKMLFDLRVVDTAGQAPGYVRACGRCALGALGTLALGLGLVPMLFDPARRGFHDRLFRTRVVRPDPPSARPS